ncbi:SPOR domain-containing protein [Streptomyces sulphureus]|uniref:SPOR domain-containing protein n=1 Tax=Streptomyces sulphureus TaxID=47758 RepID=UPI00247FCCA3|nr:SPOR domain-containing protein [Streptomyces sulphureus]
MNAGRRLRHMRSVSGDSNTVLPWHVIRQDGNGNRYRVGSYATRTEAVQIAERLGKAGGPGTGTVDGQGGYLVEHMYPPD